jgi:putative Ca2+/H+ antiporter (TMEM165/GDT1 family)
MSDNELAAAAAIRTSEEGTNTGSTGKKYDIGTKDAPVDGKDGRPHEGPFVEIENLRKNEDSKHDNPPLENRPNDPTVVDGKKIPESNDGIMFDKNRPNPKEGTTGTSGGVSEKDKARKAKEGQTGEKVENKPEPPKEAPPLPHSEEDKISSDKSTKDKTKQQKGKTEEKTAEEVIGLEKPEDLPQRTHDKAPPLPDSANKDHLDVTKGTKPGKTLAGDESQEGLIRPFHSFCLSLTMILFSEIGDKTFLVAALMAMKHDRLVVFSAAFAALITMTVLSAVLGHAVPTLIPKKVTNFLAAGLFLIFGGKLLREGLAMSPDEGVAAEMQEVEMELEEKEKEARKLGRRRSSVSPYTLEMGMGTRKSRSKSRFPVPPRSPSSSPEGRSPSPRRGALANTLSGLNNLLSLLLSPAWVQTFVMTFLGEWGDRSQIATIAMAAGQDYWWVTLGAILGHGCCTGVAVIGGRAIAGRVSLRIVTIGGAIAFLLFGVIYFVEALYA